MDRSSSPLTLKSGMCAIIIAAFQVNAVMSSKPGAIYLSEKQWALKFEGLFPFL